MFRRQLLVIACLIANAACNPARACLWDSDTLAMERRRFPDTLELVTGKFLRHSEEFYRWRIEDRKRRIEEGASALRWYDDLAVAFDKVGEHSLAIATMKSIEAQHPDRYETLANLGTFWIHSGDLEKGLQYIDSAIEINPNAHFGREVYQKRLVEYVLSKRSGGRLVLPLNQADDRFAETHEGFAEFLFGVDPFYEPEKIDKAELKKAMKGILGMMRFGQYDSPVLLEALGDLLLAQGHPNDALRLAARAYLKASYEVDDVTARHGYRSKALDALLMQTVHPKTTRELSLDELEETFKKELQEAEAWFTALREDELRWISAGKNVDEEFTNKYYQNPVVGNRTTVSAVHSSGQILWIGTAMFSSVCVLGLVYLLRRRSRSLA